MTGLETLAPIKPTGWCPRARERGVFRLQPPICPHVSKTLLCDALVEAFHLPLVDLQKAMNSFQNFHLLVFLVPRSGGFAQLFAEPFHLSEVPIKGRGVVMVSAFAAVVDPALTRQSPPALRPVLMHPVKSSPPSAPRPTHEYTHTHIHAHSHTYTQPHQPTNTRNNPQVNKVVVEYHASVLTVCPLGPSTIPEGCRLGVEGTQDGMTLQHRCVPALARSAFQPLQRALRGCGSRKASEASTTSPRRSWAAACSSAWSLHCKPLSVFLSSQRAGTQSFLMGSQVQQPQVWPRPQGPAPNEICVLRSQRTARSEAPSGPLSANCRRFTTNRR